MPKEYLTTQTDDITHGHEYIVHSHEIGTALIPYDRANIWQSVVTVEREQE